MTLYYPLHKPSFYSKDRQLQSCFLNYHTSILAFHPLLMLKKWTETTKSFQMQLWIEFWITARRGYDKAKSIPELTLTPLMLHGKAQMTGALWPSKTNLLAPVKAFHTFQHSSKLVAMSIGLLYIALEPWISTWTNLDHLVVATSDDKSFLIRFRKCYIIDTANMCINLTEKADMKSNKM